MRKTLLLCLIAAITLSLLFCTACNQNTKIISDNLIVSDIPALRDPCVVLANDVYYVYGTGWICYKNTSDSLAGPWQSVGMVVNVPEDAAGDFWAPEVHRYNNAYYMFTTYRSETTGKRGCAIFRADNPEGPFDMISNGHITPTEWYSIDGTLYIDEDGQPWMIFVREWVGTEDKIGRMVAAKMSDDLTCLISEPIELFRADDPKWTNQCVTDGPWLYKCQNGSLLMLWSNFNEDGYCIGIAKSENGKIDGEWTQQKKPFYSAKGNLLEGGHGMLFCAKDGKTYLSFHSPNSSKSGRNETPVFLPVTEKNGNLIVNAEN